MVCVENSFPEHHSDELFCCRYFNDFLRSDFYCKHQIDVLTSGNIDLADLLYNETALFYFMEVCMYPCVCLCVCVCICMHAHIYVYVCI